MHTYLRLNDGRIMILLSDNIEEETYGCYHYDSFPLNIEADLCEVVAYSDVAIIDTNLWVVENLVFTLGKPSLVEPKYKPVTPFKLTESSNEVTSGVYNLKPTGKYRFGEELLHNDIYISISAQSKVVNPTDVKEIAEVIQKSLNEHYFPGLKANQNKGESHEP